MRNSLVFVLALVVASNAVAGTGTAKKSTPRDRPWHARHAELIGAIAGFSAGTLTFLWGIDHISESRLIIVPTCVGAGAGIAAYAAAGGFSKREADAALERGRAELRFAHILATAPESVLAGLPLPLGRTSPASSAEMVLIPRR